MAATFDEILLDEAYAAIAEGGPEFATAVVPSGAGGAIEQREATREFLSKYEISYAEMSPAQWAALRNFGICRKGMARGFRFMAPDDNLLEYQLLAVLNEDDELVLQPVADGVTTEYYIVKYHGDTANDALQRITKISPNVSAFLGVWHISDLVNPIAVAEFPADTTPPIPETIDAGFFIVGGYLVTLNLFTGKLTFDAPVPPDEYVFRFTAQFHVPVAFTDDWMRFSIDEEGYGAFKIGLEEMLPAELGIV